MEESSSQYWNNVLKSADLLLSLLTPYEDKEDMDLVQNVLPPLRQLVKKGSSYSIPKQVIPAQPKQEHNSAPRRYRSIKQAEYVTFDCEFMGSKNAIPELKLLQIAVSDIYGYAIQVDILGRHILEQKLKPVMESKDVTWIGWALRSDMLSIEQFFGALKDPGILDLQRKLATYAVEELNLHAAMAKYASDWDGFQEFQRAKQYGETFWFSDDDCIWLLNPLPPRAIVYATFDVLSVHILHEKTRHLESKPEFSYPNSVTHNLSAKALTRWHNQRNKAATQLPVALPRNTTRRPSNHRKDRKNEFVLPVPVPPEPETDDGYNDNDPRFTIDVQRAIDLSLKEQNKNDHASKENQGWTMNNLANPSWNSLADNTEPKKQDDSDELVSRKPSDYPASWETSSEKSNNWRRSSVDKTSNASRWSHPSPSQPVDAKKSPSASNWKSANNWKNSVERTNWQNHSQQDEHKPTSNASNSIPGSEQPNKSQDSISYSWKPVSIIHGQTGAFTWYDDSGSKEMGPASWASFATSSNQKWNQGIDTQLDEIERAPKISNPNVSKQFNINVNPYDTSMNAEGKDSWNVKEVLPDTMEMRMNQIPMRKVFTGPRVMNPNDSLSDDSEDEISYSKKSTPKKAKASSSKKYVDEDNDDEINIHSVMEANHLNSIEIPTEPFTVAICYHFAESKSSNHFLKAIQLFIKCSSDPVGDSYTIVLEKACFKDRSLKDTNFGRLLTDPSIQRVCWWPEIIEEQTYQKLGFCLGPTIDLNVKVNSDEDRSVLTFAKSIDAYLKDWPDLYQLHEAKDEYDNAVNSKKFSGTPWDNKRIKEGVLRYSALQGFGAYALHKATEDLDILEEDCLWRSTRYTSK
ncbi:hypothetical protein EDC96DRAFT_445035 [Choanephora cucurbitarum]|nr:hypothetical protein EDC96DRAFT_445035 [Choanephora cucurbitarum]